jgi:hypothetical protein
MRDSPAAIGPRVEPELAERPQRPWTRGSRAAIRAWALRRLLGVLAAEAAQRAKPSPSLARGPRRPAQSDSRLPGSPDELAASWLTAVLCRTAPAARVTDVRVLERSAGTTTRARLELDYDEAGAAAGLPRRVFAKWASALTQRLMLGLGGFIECEPRFYAHVRQLLEIEAPAGYFAAVASRSWHSLVLIEDVASTRAARFWRPGARITRGQIEDLLAGAAAWHGALWQSPRLDGWRWLKTPAEQMLVIDALIGLGDRTRAGAERAHAVIPAGLRRRSADLYEGLRRSMRLASEGPLTYLHGDLHVANTYLAADGRMGICDWQTSLRGSWAFDFAYLLATALEVEDRRAWEAELLDFYLERLAAAGGARIPRERAWRCYRQATLYPYFAWTYTIGRWRLQPRFQPEQVSLTLLGRIAAAIEDLHSLAALGL